jgi:hypothetical protein
MTRQYPAARPWRMLAASVALLLVVAEVAQVTRWWRQRAAEIGYTQFRAEAL